MARRKLTRIDPGHAPQAAAHSQSSGFVPDLVEALRIATGEAVSRLENLARWQTQDFQLAIRELKARQRRLRSARRSLETPTG